jgi:hypothetical protein
METTRQEVLYRVENIAHGRPVVVLENRPYAEASKLAREMVALGKATFVKVMYGQPGMFIEAYQMLNGKVVKW